MPTYPTTSQPNGTKTFPPADWRAGPPANWPAGSTSGATPNSFKRELETFTVPHPRCPKSLSPLESPSPTAPDAGSPPTPPADSAPPKYTHATRRCQPATLRQSKSPDPPACHPAGRLEQEPSPTEESRTNAAYTAHQCVALPRSHDKESHPGDQKPRQETNFHARLPLGLKWKHPLACPPVGRRARPDDALRFERKSEATHAHLPPPPHGHLRNGTPTRLRFERFACWHGYCLAPILWPRLHQLQPR